MKGRKPSRQKFLFKETQVYATRSTIQRTRKQCIQWVRNGQYAGCNLKHKHCRPSVCAEFVERVTK